MYYFLCESCDAKWFGQRELCQCPRCGALAASNVYQSPPWIGATAEGRNSRLNRERPPGAAGGNPLVHAPVDAYTTSPEGKAEFSMTDAVRILKSIDQRLAAIQQQLARTPLADMLAKPIYTCRELSRLSHSHGVQSYEPFTVRLACCDSRLHGAYKRENGTWAIPRDAVIRVLENGLPPERRNGRPVSLPDDTQPRTPAR